MMNSVFAEPLNCRIYICAAVVVVVPHEIAGHANLLRLVSGRLEALVLQPEKASERFNANTFPI